MLLIHAAIGVAVRAATPFTDEWGQWNSGSPSGCDATSHAYDFLLLVQQWPRDFGQNDDYTTLHGLWPSRDGTAGPANSYPCTCTAEQFSEDNVKTILPDLQKYWPSLMGPNDSFWSHEWSKHGTCTEQSQLTFFSTTLAMRKKYDFYAALTNAGMVEGTAYDAKVYDAAFTKAYGVPAELGCDNSNGIREVSFCLSKFPAPAAIPCAASVTGTNGETTNCDRTQPISFVKTAPAPSPSPSPPGPPGPPATQCSQDKHGPPCTTNADCADKPHCVRCAHSGFCTEVPAAGAGLDFILY